MGGSRPGRAGIGRLTIAVALPRLMLVTDRRDVAGRDLVDVVAAAVAGGVGLVQVRERDLDEAGLAMLLHRLLDRLADTHARLLVNGHPELARSIGVGLHLPAAADLPSGPRPPLLGRAAHDEAEARRAVDDGVSYVVVGPVFATTSKPGHPGAGLDHLARLVRLVAPVSVFAIGGLTPARVPAVIEAGVHGVAVRSALLRAADVTAAARAFARALEGGAARSGSA